MKKYIIILLAILTCSTAYGAEWVGTTPELSTPVAGSRYFISIIDNDATAGDVSGGQHKITLDGDATHVLRGDGTQSAQDSINIEDAGAACDGTTDDTAILVSTAALRKQVVVPAGCNLGIKEAIAPYLNLYVDPSATITALTPDAVGTGHQTFLVTGDNANIKIDGTFDLNDSGITGFELDGDNANIEIKLATGCSIQTGSSTYTSVVVITGDDATFSGYGEGFLTNGITTTIPAAPRMFTVQGTATNYTGGYVISDGAKNTLAIGEPTGYGYVDYVKSINSIDNPVYHLGGHLTIGDIDIIDAEEEGVVTEGYLDITGTLKVRGYCQTPLGIEDAEYVHVNHIDWDDLGQVNDAGTYPGNIVRYRTGNVTSGDLFIGSIYARYTGASLISATNGDVGNITIGKSDIVYQYLAANTGVNLQYFMDISSAESFNLSDWNVIVNDELDSLDSSRIFRGDVKVPVDAQSSYTNIKFYATNTAGAYADHDIRINHLAQEQVETVGVNWLDENNTSTTKSQVYDTGLVDSTRNAPPLAGTWRLGKVLIDRVDNTKWVCTAAGTPGTWEQITNGSSVVTDLTGTANTVLYVDSAGDVQEVALGTTGTVLTSAGTTAAPSFSAAGTGNVSNTGTPLVNQIPYWTDANTIAGFAGFEFDPVSLLTSIPGGLEMTAGTNGERGITIEGNTVANTLTGFALAVNGGVWQYNNNDGTGWHDVESGSGTDSDAVHVNVAAEISAITAKATPTTSDYILIEDAADSNNKKRITIGDLPETSSATVPYVEQAVDPAAGDHPDGTLIVSEATRNMFLQTGTGLYTVAGTFTANPAFWDLSISPTPINGTITYSTVINCGTSGSDCTEADLAEGNYTLTATGDSGYILDAWSGTNTTDNGDGTATVVLDQDIADVTATFVAGVTDLFYWDSETLPDTDDRTTTSLSDSIGGNPIWRSGANALAVMAGPTGHGNAWHQDLTSWQNARFDSTVMPTDYGTVSLWVYRDSTLTSGTSNYLWHVNGPTGGDRTDSIGVWYSSSGYIYTRLQDDDDNFIVSNVEVDVSGYLPVDTWVYVEFSYNVSVGTTELKIDGTVRATGTGTLSTVTAWGTAAPSEIGTYVDDFGGFDEFTISQ